MNNKNKNPLDDEKNPLIIAFMAIWDDEIGPKIIDIYPNSKIGNLDKLVINIFTVYQFFWDTADSDFQRSNITIPIAKLNKVAMVLFDIIPNPEIRGGFQPFIIVFLVPDYIIEEQSNIYNEIQIKIAQDFSQNQIISLKNYYDDIKNTVSLILDYKEPIIEIEEYYSYTAAMEDFQAGLKLFQTKNFDQAYLILKKVLIKFEHEQHKHLIMEVIYLIGSLLAQQKKYETAKKYFDQLERLAIELNHDRYLELALFMEGFFEYKKENFASARKKFEEIHILKSKFINKLQYYTIYAKILHYYENYEGALQNLLNALENITLIKEPDKLKHQQIQILYEIGIIDWKIAMQGIQNFGISRINEFKPFLQEAINKFVQCAEILIELNDLEKLISVFQLIGNLYESLDDNSKFLEYYHKAMDYTYNEKFLGKRVKIFNRIVHKQMQLKRYNENISLLKDFLRNEKELKFIDLYTISILRWRLANAYLAIGKRTEGLSELLSVYECFKNFKVPVNEEFEILNQFIKIYEEIKDHEKVSHYKNELKNLSNRYINHFTETQPLYHPLAPLKEIWIYSASTGVGLYNYSPETKVDIDLLGGLMTAMQQFSLQLSQQELRNMDIGEDRYTIYKERGFDFFILGRSNTKIPIEIIEKILTTIYRRFWKEYTHEIKNFRGNVSIFKGFTKVIESFDLTLIR